MMALFKEIPCAYCGGKTGMMTRTKLKDGQYICSKCKSPVPSDVKSALQAYTLEDYRRLLRYIEESRNELRKVFRENHSFYSLHIDTENGLFYLYNFEKPLYLKFENLAEFSLTFEAEELKEGFLGDKVTGKLYLRLRMEEPYFYKEEVLASGIKAGATVGGIFKKKVTYQNPKGMDEFLHYFYDAWQTARNRKLAALLKDEY